MQITVIASGYLSLFSYNAIITYTMGQHGIISQDYSQTDNQGKKNKALCKADEMA